MMIAAIQPTSHSADADQQLLAIAISAAAIRTQLELPMCAEDRARLSADLERVELVRRTLEQHVAALEHSHRPWWRRLLQK